MSGACTQTRLPVVVSRDQEPELLGIDADRVGRLDRADGTWFAVTPTGEKPVAR